MTVRNNNIRDWHGIRIIVFIPFAYLFSAVFSL